MRKRLFAVAAVLALALSGCHYDPGRGATPSASPSVEPTAAPAISEVFTLPLDPTGGWDPYSGSKSGNMALLPLVCESLFALDGSFAPQPLLAQSGQVSEDGLSWTVRLRTGITFSDGQALDAQAVAQAVNAAKGAKSVYAGRLSGVKKVSAQEDGTVLFQLSAPNAGFLGLLDFPIALVSEGHVLGTGPYVVEEGALVARSGWWRGLELSLASIPLKEVGDADALVADLNAGNISLAAADPTGTDAVGHSGNCQSWEYPTSTMVYLGFRWGKGPCKSPEFRQAVSWAIDRGQLARQAFSGHAVAAALPIPPGASRYDRTLAAQADYDLQAAEQTLEELGYRLGEDGLRYQGKQPLALRVLVNADNPSKQAAAQAVADALGGLGVQTEVRALTWEEYKKALEKGDFDLYVGESRLAGDLDPGAFLTPGSGLCYGGFSSPTLTQALQEARRTGQWGEFYDQWTQQLPVTALCFKNAHLLTRWGQVEGASPTQGNLFYQFENWHIG